MLVNLSLFSSNCQNDLVIIFSSMFENHLECLDTDVLHMMQTTDGVGKEILSNFILPLGIIVLSEIHADLENNISGIYQSEIENKDKEDTTEVHSFNELIKKTLSNILRKKLIRPLMTIKVMLFTDASCTGIGWVL